MPRVRTVCALILVCIYFVYSTPWREGQGGFGRGYGGDEDVLKYVNMFIGTKNGGMYCFCVGQ
jgi:hypothetical protein